MCVENLRVHVKNNSGKIFSIIFKKKSIVMNENQYLIEFNAQDLKFGSTSII